MRIIAVIAPRVEVMVMRDCALGDNFAAVFATGLSALPHLRQLNVLKNDLSAAGSDLLKRAWRVGRKPPIRMRTVNNDKGFLLRKGDNDEGFQADKDKPPVRMRTGINDEGFLPALAPLPPSPKP